MMYPRNVGPTSQAQELAWLYGSLAAAWSLVAQYQEIEADVERERMKAKVFEAKPYRESPRSEVHPDEGPATEGGRTC